MTTKRLISWYTAMMLGLLMATAGCTVDKTQSGKAPDVDVDAGRLPKFNVKWADVDVGTTTKTVTVPKIEWRREETQIQVPYIDINAPGGGDREERTIAVDLEVPSSAYDLQITEVRAAGDELWVIAELKQTGKTGGYGRVSDQVVVNAPEGLDVRRVIVGPRPEGVYNQQYSFYSDTASLHRALPEGGGRVLYQRAS